MRICKVVIPALGQRLDITTQKISNEIVLDDDIIVDGVEMELSQQAKKQILTNDSVEAAVKDHRFFVTSRGLLLISVYCTFSSIAAAYGEWLLRRRKKRKCCQPACRNPCDEVFEG